MTTLVIVESPAKAKTIERFLGSEYKVTASYGHVRDLPGKAEDIPEEIKKEKWARFGVNIDSEFEPVYIIPPDKKKRVDALKKEMKKADTLLLATDEDREGESISWHLLEILKPTIPVKRIVFHEITPEAIQEALDNARDINLELVRAQESRRIVDRLYGYSLSPVLWRKVQSGLSAGRVQSVAVRLIVEREEERRAFVTSSYFDLEAGFVSPMGAFSATLFSYDDKRLATGKDFDSTNGKLKNQKVFHLETEKDAKDIVKDLQENLPWKVSKLETKEGKQRPSPPFTTSTLQQEANRKLGYSADRTMKIAQKLYEGIDIGSSERIGVITYMRTDSFTLSKRALDEAQVEIKNLYGDKYAQGPNFYRTKSRNAQEAHEAIRPTKFSRTPKSIKQYLTSEEYKLYELIWKRVIASQMPDAIVERTTVHIEAFDSQKRRSEFHTSGKRILFPGYLKAYVEGSDDPNAEMGDKENLLPALEVGQEIKSVKDIDQKKDTGLESLEAKAHETKPPARYTEAALVKKLEEEGIGRPSTYASIITTIQHRGYVSKDRSKVLVPTFTAMAVTNLMRDHFSHYVDYAFTARMEEELDEIADGKREWKDHVHNFYRGSSNGSSQTNGQELPTGLEQQIENEQERIGLPDVVLGTEEKTNQKISVRIGRYGPYVVRGDGGEGNTANIPAGVAPADFSVDEAVVLIQKKAAGPRKVGVHPDSGETIYAARGRFGPYVQLGEVTEENKKPKRASLPKGMSEEEVDLATAVKLLILPRELGPHPETGEIILANNGRYGPYVQHQKDYRSLKDEDDVYTIRLERALEIFKEPKKFGRQKKVLREVGKLEDGTVINIMEGRYGAYVTDGKTNATLPKDTDKEKLSLEDAQKLIVDKAGKPKAKKAAKKGAKKSAKKAAKKGAKKSAKKAAKKSAKKAAKKSAKKSSD